MDKLYELILISAIIGLSVYSMKISQDHVASIERMNHQIQMMFVKS